MNANFHSLPPNKQANYIPQVYAQTFGLAAVKHLLGLAHNDAEAAQIVDDPHQAAVLEYRADVHHAGMQMEMTKNRQHINGLKNYEAEILEEYCKSSVPQALKDHKKAGDADSSWQKWLGDSAGERELRAFLEWHVRSLENQQHHPEVQAAIETQREHYKINLHHAIENGWISDDARFAIRAADNVRVYIGDVFDTLMQERGGYHQRGTSEVIVATPIDGRIRGTTEDEGLVNQVRLVLGHEFNHAVLGRLGRRWLDEALTEHIHIALQTDKPEDSNLEHRVYIEERRLLATLLQGPDKASEPVPYKMATLAYSANDPKHFIGDLDRALESKWGGYLGVGWESVIDLVGKRVADYEKQLRNDQTQIKDANKRLTEIQICEEAVETTRLDLLTKPEVVFDNSYDSQNADTR